tara:strand:- start:799 stop:1539 length:741 start_codon:yes stop_codon:yes gene_type:complete
MKKKKLEILSLIILFFSCGDIKESIDKSNQRVQEKIEKTNDERSIKEVAEYYAFVDKLRVREVPGLKSKRQGAKFVDVLDEGDKVMFLGEKTEKLYEVKLRGRQMNAPFYKIKTQNGEIGWIYAGALTSFPVEVEHYRVAIFFDEAGNYEQGGDFSYYASRAMNNLLGTGIDAIYVDDDYDEVEIRSHRGDGKIIGTENISRLVKKHKIGVVCVEKGRSQKFVYYSPDMYWDILEKFDMLGGHCLN